VLRRACVDSTGDRPWRGDTCLLASGVAHCVDSVYIHASALVTCSEWFCPVSLLPGWTVHMSDHWLAGVTAVMAQLVTLPCDVVVTG